MNPQSSIPLEVARLGRAIRFSMVCLVVGLSYFTIRVSFDIVVIQRLLAVKPVSVLTDTVFIIRPWLVICSLFTPLLAIATLFSRRLVTSFYVLGVLALLTILQFALEFVGLGLSTSFFNMGPMWSK